MATITLPSDSNIYNIAREIRVLVLQQIGHGDVIVAIGEAQVCFTKDQMPTFNHLKKVVAEHDDGKTIVVARKTASGKFAGGRIVRTAPAPIEVKTEISPLADQVAARLAA